MARPKSSGSTRTSKSQPRKRNEESTDPIPAFYCVYLLQSSVTRKSHYIGSTPDPARRIAQHNGRVVGGAKRTSKDLLRPWEMVLFVSGFMSRIAALQFEWAWQHTSKSHHIGPKERRKEMCRAGRTLGCLLFNLSVLLHSRCFSQWGLEVHFFNEEVCREWEKQILKAPRIVTGVGFRVIRHERAEELNGLMSSFDTGYNALRKYLQKSRRLMHQEKQHEEETWQAEETGGRKQKDNITRWKEQRQQQTQNCGVCQNQLVYEDDIIIVCCNDACECMTHMICLASKFLKNEDTRMGRMIPEKGPCPGCQEEVKWSELMRELSLRLRGGKYVEKICKTKISRKVKCSQDVGVSEECVASQGSVSSVGMREPVCSQMSGVLLTPLMESESDGDSEDDRSQPSVFSRQSSVRPAFTQDAASPDDEPSVIILD